MRRWILYGAVFGLAALLNVTGFVGTDVGKLRPVEAVRLSRAGSKVILQTDTGDIGVGTDPGWALEDMRNCAVGTLFLETADYLILQPGCEELLNAMSELLRPSCKVCVESGETKPEEAAAYLRVHEPQMTIRDWLGGKSRIPILKDKGGRLELVP